MEVRQAGWLVGRQVRSGSHPIWVGPPGGGAARTRCCNMQEATPATIRVAHAHGRRSTPHSPLGRPAAGPDQRCGRQGVQNRRPPSSHPLLPPLPTGRPLLTRCLQSGAMQGWTRTCGWCRCGGGGTHSGESRRGAGLQARACALCFDVPARAPARCASAVHPPGSTTLLPSLAPSLPPAVRVRSQSGGAARRSAARAGWAGGVAAAAGGHVHGERTLNTDSCPVNATVQSTVLNLYTWPLPSAPCCAVGAAAGGGRIQPSAGRSAGAGVSRVQHCACARLQPDPPTRRQSATLVAQLATAVWPCFLASCHAFLQAERVVCVAGRICHPRAADPAFRCGWGGGGGGGPCRGGLECAARLRGLETLVCYKHASELCEGGCPDRSSRSCFDPPALVQASYIPPFNAF